MPAEMSERPIRRERESAGQELAQAPMGTPALSHPEHGESVAEKTALSQAYEDANETKKELAVLKDVLKNQAEGLSKEEVKGYEETRDRLQARLANQEKERERLYKETDPEEVAAIKGAWDQIEAVTKEETTVEPKAEGHLKDVDDIAAPPSKGPFRRFGRTVADVAGGVGDFFSNIGTGFRLTFTSTRTAESRILDKDKAREKGKLAKAEAKTESEFLARVPALAAEMGRIQQEYPEISALPEKQLKKLGALMAKRCQECSDVLLISREGEFVAQKELPGYEQIQALADRYLEVWAKVRMAERQHAEGKKPGVKPLEEGMNRFNNERKKYLTERVEALAVTMEELPAAEAELARIRREYPDLSKLSKDELARFEGAVTKQWGRVSEIRSMYPAATGYIPPGPLKTTYEGFYDLMVAARRRLEQLKASH